MLPLDSQAPAKLIPFIDKANETGVRHMLFISKLKADLGVDKTLRTIEQ